MNYPETLEYLFAQLPMFSRIGPSAYKKDLKNTLELCRVLSHPEQKFKSVHIAGTNGKGSTSHMLASIFQEAGYKTGLYTSPHLLDFRERIRVNGKPVPEEVVVEFVDVYKTEFEQIAPSFFEWTVAFAFDYFAKEKVDVAIVETGLGGRLDSTNIINPEVSVITNIGWDHMDMLGHTLEQIAVEKAGIIKPHKPVIIGEYASETAPVFVSKAKTENAPLEFAEQVIDMREFILKPDGIEFSAVSSTNTYQQVFCDLGGLYQCENIRTVLAAKEALERCGYYLPESALRKGLKQVKSNTGLMGRWQIIGTSPLFVCDTGHNANGLSFVTKQIEMQQYQHLHMVLGVVREKDLEKILKLMPRNATYYFCNAGLPRALPAEELKLAAEAEGLKGHEYPSVANAVTAARIAAGDSDMIFVGGSTFVVAEALAGL